MTRPEPAPAARAVSPLLVLGVLGLALVLLGLTVVAEGLVLAAVRGLSEREGLAAATRDPGLLALAQTLGLGLPVLFAASLEVGGPRVFFARALAPVPWDRVAAAFVAGLALQLPMVELSHLVTDLWPAVRHSPESEAALRETLRVHDAYSAVMVPLALVVSAPVTEELLFRAFAQRELEARLGARVALPLVAVLFALFHGDAAGLASIFLAGLALGAIAARWRSVRISIALHAGVNLVPVAVTEAWLPIAGFNDASPETHVAPAVLGASLAVFLLAAALAWRGSEA